jgi:hypothetical protein
MIKLQQPTRLSHHIVHASGKSKTVCVTACLTALGIPVDGFNYTGTLNKPNYLSILNRFGFTARSRKSKMPKGLTIGACRKAITKLGEDVVYFVVVRGNGYCHAILLDGNGVTRVDTAPRKLDKRKVYSIHAIARA